MTRRLTLLTGALFIVSALGVWSLTTDPPNLSEPDNTTTDESRAVVSALTATAVTEIPDGTALGPDDRDPELIVLTDLTPGPPADAIGVAPQPVILSAVEEAAEEVDSPAETGERPAPRIKRSGQASVRIDASLDTARGGARIRTVSIGARPSAGVGLSIGTGGDPICRPTHAGPTFINRRGVRSLTTGLSAPRY